MTRTVEDAMLVRQAVSGPDPGDLSSAPGWLDFDAGASIHGLRVGYFAGWMNEIPATDVDRAVLETVKQLGMIPVEVNLPDWPYDMLNVILFAEAAAAFEELTLSGGLDQLKVQAPDAWPNSFLQAQVDLLLVPSLRDEILVITNSTGHPSLTLRAGFVEVSEARSDWAPDPQEPTSQIPAAPTDPAWRHVDREAA